ncbi:hypothetical protein DFH09DRAFT_1288234 [Mycena vulgaris]|nr:hypothetical protein DFH09DRAFT_1288234 [Mycena vulgaris]
MLGHILSFVALELAPTHRKVLAKSKIQRVLRIRLPYLHPSRAVGPSEFADVRRREDPDDYSAIPAWSCTLCTDYSPSFEIQKYLEDHIRRTHLIDKPIKGEHLILFKGSEPPRRRAIMLFVAGAIVACYRCNRCAREFPDVVKLFPKRTIRRHIQKRKLNPQAIIGRRWNC